MIGPPGFIDKTIREDKTTFDKTAIAQQMLDILSGYREIEGVQQLIGTILNHTLETLKASELPETTLVGPGHGEGNCSCRQFSRHALCRPIHRSEGVLGAPPSWDGCHTNRRIGPYQTQSDEGG